MLFDRRWGYPGWCISDLLCIFISITDLFLLSLAFHAECLHSTVRKGGKSCFTRCGLSFTICMLGSISFEESSPIDEVIFFQYESWGLKVVLIHLFLTISARFVSNSGAFSVEVRNLSLFFRFAKQLPTLDG